MAIHSDKSYLEILSRIGKALETLKPGEIQTSCECPRCQKTIWIKKLGTRGFQAKCETPGCTTIIA